jgi:hypothetical protein
VAARTYSAPNPAAMRVGAAELSLDTQSLRGGSPSTCRRQIEAPADLLDHTASVRGHDGRGGTTAVRRPSPARGARACGTRTTPGSCPRLGGVRRRVPARDQAAVEPCHAPGSQQPQRGSGGLERRGPLTDTAGRKVAVGSSPMVSAASTAAPSRVCAHAAKRRSAIRRSSSHCSTTARAGPSSRPGPATAPWRWPRWVRRPPRPSTRSRPRLQGSPPRR